MQRRRTNCAAWINPRIENKKSDHLGGIARLFPEVITFKKQLFTVGSCLQDAFTEFGYFPINPTNILVAMIF